MDDDLEHHCANILPNSTKNPLVSYKLPAGYTDHGKKYVHTLKAPRALSQNVQELLHHSIVSLIMCDEERRKMYGKGNDEANAGNGLSGMPLYICRPKRRTSRNFAFLRLCCIA